MEIFISHSQQDRNVAFEFKKWFENFGNHWLPETGEKVSVFLSSKLSNDQYQSEQWQDNFQKHLAKSSVVVILVTPKSINSRWVQYETGYAMAIANAKNKKIPIFQIGIRGVSPEKILLGRNYVHFVKTGKDIQSLWATLFKVPNTLAEGWYNANSKDIAKLINLCNERCVYFVGSKPKGDLDEEKWKEGGFVENFLNRLTIGLLKKGSRVSSYPTVKELGERVYYAAKDFEDNDVKGIDLYEISGLYNFDKPLETSKKEPIELKTWIDYLSEFREHYLENKDSVIIVGGNDHTKEECEVAEKLGYIELFPIPCMGGYAKKKYEEISKQWWWEKFNHPCKECFENGIYKRGMFCDQIDPFTKRLEQYRYINEDEREP